MIKTPTKELYSTDEVAEKMGWTISRVSQIARDHKIGTMIGTGRFFSKSELRKIKRIPDGRSTKGKKIGNST